MSISSKNQFTLSSKQSNEQEPQSSEVYKKSQGKKSIEFYAKKTGHWKQEPIQYQSKFMSDKRGSMPARFRAHGEIRSNDLQLQEQSQIVSQENKQNDQIPYVQSSLQSDTLQVDMHRQIVYENLDDDTPRAV